MSDLQRFPFRFDPLYRPVAVPFGVTEATAVVEIDGTELRARFGLWSVRTPLSNVTGAEVIGPFSVPKTIGPAHLSLTDRGLTFATNRDRGVCIRFAEPIAGIDPVGAIRHPGLTVTVADVDGLRAALTDAAEATA